MENLKLHKEIAALLVIDPYNDFISEGGKYSHWIIKGGIGHCLRKPRRPLPKLSSMSTVIDQR